VAMSCALMHVHVHSHYCVHDASRKPPPCIQVSQAGGGVLYGPAASAIRDIPCDSIFRHFASTPFFPPVINTQVEQQ
jgi:hypothetical protein